MSLSKISITEGQGGTGRILTSDDNKSGLLFYLPSNQIPSGFTSGSKQIFSLAEAEAAGVTVSTTPIAHYHVSEFYRVNPSGLLQVKFTTTPSGSTTFSEVTSIQTDADGILNQIGVYTKKPFTTSMVTTLQSVLTQLKTDDMPAIALLAANYTGFTVSSLPDLTGSLSNLVSVVVGQDSGGVGGQLYASQGASISCLGAAVGTVGASSVHESIAWTGKYNLSGAGELDTLAIANGTSYKSITKTALGQLNDKHYIFPLKYAGLNGSFFNSSFTTISETSDYLTIERNRTINKARKLLRIALLPQLNSPLYLSDDGTLTIETVGKFESLCSQALDGMRRAGELSNYKVTIDPDQDVLSNDELAISVDLLPVGVARFITITLGYTVSIA